MAVSSSKSPSTKKAAANGTKASESSIKLPEEFIVRPYNYTSSKSLCEVVINNEVLKLLGLKENANNFIDFNKVNSINMQLTALVTSSADLDTNVVLIGDELRALCNLTLGDRVYLKKNEKMPGYCTNVKIKTIPTIDNNEITKMLSQIGLVYPGMILKKDVQVIDMNYPSLNEECLEQSLKNMDLNVKNVERVAIYHPKNTVIDYTSSPNDCLNLMKYPKCEGLTFDSLGGMKQHIDQLRKNIDLPLNKPEIFQEFGISPPRGILLHGPPGTGKTMLLKCIANEFKTHVLSINGPSIVSKYLGGTEEALRNIFLEAQRFQPAIIFIDEIDSLAPNRSNDESGEMESRVVATLLTLMDGFDGAFDKICIVGATNRPNSIDPALRRPGRFDQELEIGIPDMDARFEILMKQFDRMNGDKRQLSVEDIKAIASKTHGYVGADLTALVRESVMKCVERTLTGNLDGKLCVEDINAALLDIRPSTMREIFLEMPKVYWSDIGGQHELKRKMKEMIELPLQYAKTFQNLGVKCPKGILMYGPPGCSKTLTAKALATESGINFLAVKGPEIFNKFVGESERTIREIFRKARSASPSIIFFDEIDAISRSRDEEGGSSVHSTVLTTLLNEIDGVEELNGVVIVAATNRPDEIDSALLRPGRLDRHIFVSPPDYEARLQIIKNCTRKFKMDQQEKFEEYLEHLAKETKGCSGAEVVLMCQEAGLNAIMESLDKTNTVLPSHFESAVKNISRGITQDMLDYYKDFESRSGIDI
ncbi:related to ATPase family gene 2 protein [Hanseniaspora guilliermondii]|uniref:Related to ATPase family gene 2 protein n=1 Tax=Hanseniaspora guilliermondii TaxID=56406 RepID=A0A1L0AVY2_9ASCO|nr:related to ATPase family gene 2 protein [Hanseniaspora guilliermondii]